MAGAKSGSEAPAVQGGARRCSHTATDAPCGHAGVSLTPAVGCALAEPPLVKTGRRARLRGGALLTASMAHTQLCASSESESESRKRTAGPREEDSHSRLAHASPEQHLNFLEPRGARLTHSVRTGTCSTGNTVQRSLNIPEIRLWKRISFLL